MINLRKLSVMDSETHTTSMLYELFAEPEEIVGEVVTVTVGRNERQLLAGVLRQIALFNEDPEQRIRRGHDCGAFALACLGVDVDDVDMGPDKSRLRAGLRSGHDERIAGTYEDWLRMKNEQEAIVIFNGPPDVGRLCHVTVPVSCDGQHPNLYASKFGIEGCAAVSTLDQMHKLYGDVVFRAGVELRTVA